MPIVIEGLDWHAVGAEVVGLAFYDDKGRLIWRQKNVAAGMSAEEGKKKNEIINLYR
jgi:hypothetical protein